MNNSLKIQGSKSKSVFVLFITLFLMLYVLAKSGIAQEPATVDSVQKTEAPQAEKKMTGAMSKVLNELKSGSEDSPLGSIIMIIGVVAIVGVAMYMSFKSDGKKAKS